MAHRHRHADGSEHCHELFQHPRSRRHLYLNDAVICTAAILLDPLGAFIVGGVGAFLGDFFFYPAPMFVSLLTHGLQAVVVSLCAHKLFADRRGRGALVGVILGVVINVVGYSIGRAFVYATPEAAMLKFPFQVFQATFGAVVAMLLCFKAGLLKFWDKFSVR